MKYKTLLIIIFITSLLLIIGINIYNREEINKEDIPVIENNKEKNEESIITKIYDRPIISKVYNQDDYLYILASNYVYGDINYDLVVDNLDLELYDYLLNNNFVIPYDQLLLADLNKDQKISIEDKNILNKYLLNNSIYKYNQNNNLLYCISNINDYNNCNWDSNNYFNVTNDVYIFVKNINNNEISNSYEYKYINVPLTFSLDDDK